MKSCYVEVPFDDALLFLYSKAEENSEALPEKMAEKRENLGKLQIAFASLTDDEKELIWLLYLCKEPLTESPLEHKYLPVIKNVLLKDNQIGFLKGSLYPPINPKYPISRSIRSAYAESEIVRFLLRNLPIWS